MKKFLASALAVVFALALVFAPVDGARADGAAVDFKYELDEYGGFYTLTEYNGRASELVIPAEIDGVPVKRLGDELFSGNAALVSVEIPEGVERVGAQAFYSCVSLKSVALPSTMQLIGAGAFSYCEALESVDFPASVALIDVMAFYSCKALTTLRFRGGLPLVGDEAFAFLPDEPIVYAPDDLLSEYCELLGVDCEAGGADSVAIDWTVPEALIGFNAKTGEITWHSSYAARLDFPAEIGGVAVTAIAASAFEDDGDQSVVNLPEGLTAIGERAFASTATRYVSLPSTLKVVGDEAFADSELYSLTLPGELEFLGEGAFADSALEEIEIGEGLRALPKETFSGCVRLRSVCLPSTIEAIGENAFEGCAKLNYVLLPAYDISFIADGAFDDCALADFDIALDASKAQEEAASEHLQAIGVEDCDVWRANLPDQAPYPEDDGDEFTFDAKSGLLTAYTGEQEALTPFWNWRVDGELVAVAGLGEGVFAGANISRFDVPRSNKFTVIGARAFEGSALAEINLFDSVTAIGERAFADCSELREIVLPVSVTEVGREAFAGCVGLRSARFECAACSIGAEAFKGAEAALIVLPAEAELAEGALSGVPLANIRVADGATDSQLAALSAALGLPEGQSLVRESEAPFEAAGAAAERAEGKSASGKGKSAADSAGADAELGEVRSAPDEAEAARYVGQWLLASISIGEIELPAPVSAEWQALTLNEDGTAVLADDGEAVDYAWSCADGRVLLIGDEGELEFEYLDGALVYGIYGSTLVYKRAAVNADGGEIDPQYVGTWYLTGARMGRTVIAATGATLDGRMELNEDGSAALRINGDEELADWYVSDGVIALVDGAGGREYLAPLDGQLTAELDGLIIFFGREPSAPIIAPIARQAVSAEEFVGKWTAFAFSLSSSEVLNSEGLNLGSVDWTNVRFSTFDSEIDMSVDYDGAKVELVYDGSRLTLPAAFDDGALTIYLIGENAVLRLTDDGGAALEVNDYMFYLAKEAAPEVDYGFVGKEYVAVSGSADGQPIDADSLKLMGRYAIAFDEDGSATLTIGGVSMSGGVWMADGEAVTVDYYGMLYKFERSEAGFTLDYYGSILLGYEEVGG